MPLILVRYGELGLKSKNVRERFQRTLIKNIEDLFLHEKIEARISGGYGRIYVYVDELSKGINALKRVFGIVSLSPTIETTSNMKKICDTVSKYSKKLLKKGDSFAIRARRTGTHPYTSQDLARELGSVVLRANREKDVRVNLTKPDIEIFVEVRDNKAFVFRDIIHGPGGLPLGTQGEVLALVTDKKSMVVAWLMMKRGCKTTITCFPPSSKYIEHLKKWDLNLEVNEISMDKWVEDVMEIAKKGSVEALVLGWGLEEFEKKGIETKLPIFYPIIGMSKKEIEKIARKIVE